MKARYLFAAALLGLVVLLAANLASVFAASNPFPSGAGKVGAPARNQAIPASQLKPSECTGTVSSVQTVSGTASYGGTNVLVVASSGADTITQNAGSGYTCFVGGAGVDNFTGRTGVGDQCIVSNATPAGNIKRCTIVARRP